MQKSAFFTQVAFWCLSDIISYVEMVFWLLKTAKTLTLQAINATLHALIPIHITSNPLPTHIMTPGTIIQEYVTKELENFKENRVYYVLKPYELLCVVSSAS